MDALVSHQSQPPAKSFAPTGNRRINPRLILALPHERRSRVTDKVPPWASTATHCVYCKAPCHGGAYACTTPFLESLSDTSDVSL
jgi:hypothetical protein